MIFQNVIIYLKNMPKSASPRLAKDQAIEVLDFSVAGTDVLKWTELDTSIWTKYLSVQKGYVGKMVIVDEKCDQTKTDLCRVWSVVNWASLKDWKSISTDELAQIDQVS